MAEVVVALEVEAAVEVVVLEAVAVAAVREVLAAGLAPVGVEALVAAALALAEAAGVEVDRDQVRQAAVELVQAHPEAMAARRRADV